ncbi:unnamed protein product, partial [Symbiodinium microadriaticum]
VGWDWGLLSGFFTTAAVTGILVLQFVLYAGNKVEASQEAGKGHASATKKESKKTQ